MSSKYAVHVSNISPSTTKGHLHDFFSFCGKIADTNYKEGETEATVYFEKPSAVTTAKMLNGGDLDGSKLTVKAEEPEAAAHHEEHHEAEVRQEDKPRAGIAAEYLAKGYVLSENILQKAIQIDRDNGISTRFLEFVRQIDTTVGQKALGPDQTVSGRMQETYLTAVERAKHVDEQKGYSQHLRDAAKTPLWQKVKRFYEDTAKQVQDIHEEARRIADHHKNIGDGTKTEKPAKAAEATGTPEASK